MNLVIGLHHHKHGVSVHALDVEGDSLNYSESDFIDFLLKEDDEDYEPEHGDWVEVIGVASDQIKKVMK